jgi:hypothetical protein
MAVTPWRLVVAMRADREDCGNREAERGRQHACDHDEGEAGGAHHRHLVSQQVI